MNKKSTELLPCPFCGSDADVEPRGGGEYWIARCNRRFLPNSYRQLCPINGRTRGESTRDDAIRMWNTRHTEEK